jgi:hypothetical protein
VCLVQMSDTLTIPFLIAAVGGPKDKACFVEGMMYSVLHRYTTLQNDQDDLHRMLEVLRQDLDRALWEENDYTIVPAEMLNIDASVDEGFLAADNDGSLHYAAHNIMPDLPNLEKEKDIDVEDDLRYPNKPPKQQEDLPSTPVARTKLSPSGGAFALENIPVFGRFMCGNPERQSSIRSTEGIAVAAANSAKTLSPRTPISKPNPRNTQMNAYRDDMARGSPHTGINFRTGLSGHKGLSSHHSTKMAEQNMTPRTETLHLMSVTNGIAPTKRHRNKTPTDARAMWEKEFQEAAKFSLFPGVARRPTPHQSSSTSAPKASGLSITLPNIGGGPMRAASPRAEVNSVVRVPVSRVPGTSGGPPLLPQQQPEPMSENE